MNQKIQDNVDRLLALRDEKSKLAGEPSRCFYPDDGYMELEWAHQSGRDLWVMVYKDSFTVQPSDDDEEWGMEPDEINKHLHWLLEGNQ